MTMNLNAQEQFNKNDAYFVILRGKGDAAEVISKTKYTIDIAFTSDFEF